MTGNGFWTFANTAHPAPTVSDSLANETPADLYVPQFMSSFWSAYSGNWNNQNHNNNEDMAEIININNVHVHNFNIQPLTEIDIQFQSQPQEQAQLNGFIFQKKQEEWWNAGADTNGNSTSASNTGGVNNYGNQQWNDQWNYQQQGQDYSNQWPQHNDVNWPFTQNQQNNNGALSEFIKHSGNTITVNTLGMIISYPLSTYA